MNDEYEAALARKQADRAWLWKQVETGAMTPEEAQNYASMVPPASELVAISSNAWFPETNKERRRRRKRVK